LDGIDCCGIDGTNEEGNQSFHAMLVSMRTYAPEGLEGWKGRKEEGSEESREVKIDWKAKVWIRKPLDL
jgi:hypothetical protein